MTGTRIGLALVLVAALLLVSSTGGVSSTTMERSVSIDIVDDEQATVGFTVVNETDDEVEISVENSLNENLTVNEEQTVESGKSETVSVEHDDCDDIVVSAEGDSTTVDRTFEVDSCD